MNRSDFECLGLLDSSENDLLTQEEIYRACVAVSNNGLFRKEESMLSMEQRFLLDMRRKIKAGLLSEVKEALEGFNSSDSAIMGDHQFLLGTVAHREGNPELAGKFYFKAAGEFHKAGDLRRELRALINSLICQNDLNQYMAGSLYSLEQKAKRNGFYDLVGVVKKGRAGELLTLGRFSEAAQEAESAADNFSEDGCAEDLAVSNMTAAIAHLMSGDLKAAQVNRAAVHLSGGKIVTYLDAYDALINGRIPQLPSGHPLEKAPWSVYAVKQGSITGKILRRLQIGPATPDELIEETWGKSALHPSYRNRLFVAISKLKKTSNVAIVFDGQVYKVA